MDTKTKEILSKVRHLEIYTKHLAEDTFVGKYHSAFKGQGMNFEEVREYFPGDDVRAIDWNVTAKANKAYIKRFEEERELTIILAMDVSASLDFGSYLKSKRELAAEIASILAFAAVKNNDRVGLLLYSDIIELYIPPNKGKSHILRIVRELLFYKAKSKKTRTTSALDFLNQVVTRKSIIFFISDFLNLYEDNFIKEFEKKVFLTAKKHDLVCIQVYDKNEKFIKDFGVINLEDLETEEQIEVNTTSCAFRAAYKESIDGYNKELVNIFKNSKVDYLSFNSEDSYILQLVMFFKKRKISR